LYGSIEALFQKSSDSLHVEVLGRNLHESSIASSLKRRVRSSEVGAPARLGLVPNTVGNPYQPRAQDITFTNFSGSHKKVFYGKAWSPVPVRTTLFLHVF